LQTNENRAKFGNYFNIIMQTPKKSLEYSIIISAGIHFFALVIVFYFPSNQNQDIIVIKPPSGSSVRILSKFRNPGKGEPSLNAEAASAEGASIEQEIEKFKKNLTYPASAIEKGLESECEWLVTVAENSKSGNVEESRQCRYRIFDREFRKNIADWKFDLPPGTIIRIPVSYKIQQENDRNN
jgi:outer membrane biosynthesis protein TonB